MSHIIVHGVPGRTENALLAIRIIGDDIYRRNLSLLVDRNMIIGNHTAIALRKVRTKTSLAGCSPNLLHNATSILHRHALTVELGALTAYHIQKDAIARIVTLWFVLAPILGTQSPTVAIVLNISPLRCSPVFGIETYEIYTYVRIQLLVCLQLACNFQHDSYSAGTIVGCHHRLAPIGTVGIVICPRATVPMSTEQNAGFSLRVVMGNDIGILQYRAIITLQVCLLGLYLAAKLLELAYNPFATLIVRLAVHHARSEIALRCTISQCRIGIESRTYGIQFLCFLYLLHIRRTCAAGILIADGTSHQTGSNHHT